MFKSVFLFNLTLKTLMGDNDSNFEDDMSEDEYDYDDELISVFRDEVIDLFDDTSDYGCSENDESEIVKEVHNNDNIQELLSFFTITLPLINMSLEKSLILMMIVNINWSQKKNLSHFFHLQ